MPNNTILHKGKYYGYTFEDILKKDLNYCNFIMSLKYASADMKDFQDWLKVNIDEAKKAFADKESERINKQYTS